MKRTISMLLCLMLVLSLAVPAFAAGETYTLKIDSTVPDHTFEAWQIFSGKLETVAGTSTLVLTEIDWGKAIKGTGYDNSAALLAEIQSIAVQADAPDEFKALKDITAPGVLAEAIADNFGENTPELEQLSRIFEKHFQADQYTAEDDYTDNKYEMTNLPAGYYLIKDKDNSLIDDKGTPGDPTDDVPLHDSYTKFILRVLKNETVQPKATYPDVDKTINDTLGGTFGEHEDFDINDYAYYKWEGTLPSNLKSYDEYFYAFHDTLKHKGLTFMRIEQIYIEGHDGNVVEMFYDISAKEDKVAENQDNNPLPAGFALNVTENTDGTTNIDLVIDNLFDIYAKDSWQTTHKVIIKYSVRINRNAIAEGQGYSQMDNEVTLEFSNDPNAEGDGTHGETPPDVAHAFTFSLKVHKYDGDAPATNLEGAEFILYYKRTEGGVSVNYYAQVVTEEMIYVADADGNLTSTLKPESERTINGKALTADDIGVVYGWTKIRDDASILDTNADGVFNIRGLDEDEYFLEETKAPAGYNMLKAPIVFEIDPSYKADDGTLESVVYKIDGGVVSSSEIPVANYTGSTLPSTGGVGTTLFYVFGSVLFIGAAVLLITKKRMSA